MYRMPKRTLTLTLKTETETEREREREREILLQLPLGYAISPLKRVIFKIRTTSRQF